MLNIRIENIISAPIWAINFFLRFQLYYMLDIVPSCNIVQYQGKLINQTWKNDKKPNFGPDFGLFGPNLGFQGFFTGFE